MPAGHTVGENPAPLTSHDEIRLNKSSVPCRSGEVVLPHIFQPLADDRRRSPVLAG